jgi:hypothetical protein
MFSSVRPTVRPMKLRVALSAGALVLTSAFVPAVAAASPAHVSIAAHHHHKCTRTSSGSCIRGGEFCPQAKYGKHGWDAKGRRYTCKGSHSHPHWEK